MFEDIFLLGFNFRSEDHLVNLLDANFHSSNVYLVKDFRFNGDEVLATTKAESHPLLKSPNEEEINISLDNKLTIINLPQIFSEKHQDLLNSKISKIISIENFSIYEKYLSNINKNIQIITLPTNNNDLSMRIQIAKSISNGNINTSENNEKIIKFENLVIDTEKYLVTLENKKIDLTFKELELLKVLATNPGRVFSRENLLKNIWDYDYYGGTRTVDVHVRRLRRKIEDHKNNFIETIWNVGYKFNENKVGNSNE